MAEESVSQEQPKFESILKQTMPVSQSECLKLRALVDSFRREFSPQNPFEQFLFEKLVTDVCRLAKLYEFEEERISSMDMLTYHITNNKGVLDRFVKYKNSIVKDIDDGYLRLKGLKNARNTLNKSAPLTANDESK